MHTSKRRTLTGLLAICTLMFTFGAGALGGSAHAQTGNRPGPREPRDPGTGAGREKLTCEERCQKVHDNTLKVCTERGGEDCENKAKLAQEACATRCANRPAPVTCEQGCEKRAAEALTRCQAAGGENCDARVAELLAACLTRCANPPEVKPQGCDERCANQARRVHAACLREADPGVNCDEKARAAQQECKDRCENPPVQPTCPERCASHAARVEQACLNAGGTAADCTTKKEDALAKCTLRCDNGGTGTEPGPREPKPGRPGRP